MGNSAPTTYLTAAELAAIVAAKGRKLLRHLFTVRTLINSTVLPPMDGASGTHPEFITQQLSNADEFGNPITAANDLTNGDIE